MKQNNDIEVMRMGQVKDLDILNPAEQEEILGGDTQTECQKGYNNFLWTTCDCGYKVIVTDDEDEDEVPNEKP